ncbi:MAG TPA: metallophosphoesterase family protein [Kiloniellales bacterium]|nr:metallophosphoesterase family protein [Kiloniellales bacterium]
MTHDHDHNHEQPQGRGLEHAARAEPTRDMTERGPVAIISCIHGNLPALEAVWADIRGRGITEVLCLGDLVGYGPWPAEVVRFIEEKRVPTIQGCWDEGIGEEKGDCGCHFVSEAEGAAGEWSYQWTAERIGERERAFLKRLPPAIAARAGGSRLVAVHGSPRSAHEYLTAETHELVLYERAGSAGADVLLFGHTHVPYVERIEGQLALSVDTTAPETAEPPILRSLRPKLFINAGSVGEPRHGSPEATYVVFDPASLDVTIVGVDYDLKATLAAMRKAEMPPAFIERLQHGRELAVKDKTVACDC